MLYNGIKIQGDCLSLITRSGRDTIGIWLQNADASVSFGNSTDALQRALQSAVQGDTIVVNVGSYAGPISVPAGVEIVGRFTDCRITNATTSNTVTMNANSALKGIEIEGPISGGNSAIMVSHTSGQVRLVEVTVLGNGGLHGLSLSSGPLAFAFIKDCRYRGDLTGDVFRYESGMTISEGVSFDTGSCANFLHFAGGTHSGNKFHASPAPGDSLDAGLMVTATSGIFRFKDVVFASIAWNTGASAIHLMADGAETSIENFRFGSHLPYHLLADASLTGVGTKIILRGDMNHTKISAPALWYYNAELIGDYSDLGSEGDEARRFLSEVTIGSQVDPRELIVGGDSSSHHLLAYTLIGSTFTDVSTELRAANVSSVTLGSGLNDCLYIGCTEHFWDGSTVDYFKFPGFKAVIATALGTTDIAANALILEFGDDSSGWTDLQTMSVGNEHDPLAYADTPLQRAASEQVHFDCRLCTGNGTDPATGAPVLWTKNDPISLGTDLYWMRIRNRVALSDPAPVLKQIKLYPIARTEIEGTGEIHFYGGARPSKDLPLYLGAAARPPVSPPANRNLFYSEDHMLGLDYNEFATGVEDSRTWQFSVPLDLDTSSGIHFTMKGRASSTATGNMYFKLIIGHSASGCLLDNSNPGAPLVGDETTTLLLAEPASTNVETRFLLSAVSRRLLARRSKSLLDDGDNLFITLVRDGTDPLDTYSGAFALSQVTARYYAWK